MKFKSILLAFAAVLSSSYASAGIVTLSIIDTPSTTGTMQQKAGYGFPQGAYQTYDTTGNIAYGKTVTASSSIVGFPDIHSATFLTDGAYGNGSSWISANPNSYFVVDLGSAQNVNSVTFGRDRLGFFNDRDPVSFSIALSSDNLSFTTIYTSATNYQIDFNDSVKVSFDATSSRYVMLSFAGSGAAIDEIQISAAVPEQNTAAVPEPNTYALLLVGMGLLGTVARRRKQK